MVRTCLPSPPPFGTPSGSGTQLVIAPAYDRSLRSELRIFDCLFVAGTDRAIGAQRSLTAGARLAGRVLRQRTDGGRLSVPDGGVGRLRFDNQRIAVAAVRPDPSSPGRSATRLGLCQADGALAGLSRDRG